MCELHLCNNIKILLKIVFLYHLKLYLTYFFSNKIKKLIKIETILDNKNFNSKICTKLLI